MTGLNFVTSLFVSLLSPVLQGGPITSTDDPDRAHEIRAKSWLNAQPVRLFDSPKVALVAFFATGSSDSEKLLKSLNRLHQRYSTEKHLLVVGLTAEDCQRTEAYLRRKRLRFKVGCGSDTAQQYSAKAMPLVILVDLKQQRVLWRAEGTGIEAREMEAAVAARVGLPGDADRSARLAAAELADRGVYMAHAEEVLRTVEDTVGAILVSRPTGEPLQPEDLLPIAELYEQNLPSDPLGPDARSESLARSFLTGAQEETGYGMLAASGRLSEESRREVQDRTLSILEDDPDMGVRLNAAINLGRLIGRQGDAELLEALRSLNQSERHPLVRGHIRAAIDRINPQTSAEIRKALDSPTTLDRLRKLRNCADPSSSRWAQAHSYRQTITAKSISELLTDYWSIADGTTDLERENASLMRFSAVTEITNRIESIQEPERIELQSNLTRMISHETDSWTRIGIFKGLQEIAKKSTPAQREEIIQTLSAHLPDHRDPYRAGPMLEFIVDDLRQTLRN
ncbi:MAG: hypothetical protein AABZ47_13685 [Planctomycetota bacterium]